MKILLVEDDDRIAQSLAEALNDQNYIVDIAEDGELGWEYINASSYDLLILDVMLPKRDGISLCQLLRRSGYTMPVLMLTAKDTRDDKVLSLDVGADDYVVKPFDLQELLARIRALLRRGNTLQPAVLDWGNLRLDPATCEVTYTDQSVKDNGIGIAAAHLPHIFDRFWRANPSRTHRGGGSGLGLAIAQAIAQAHDGEITVTSQVGQGSNFQVRLPLA